MSEDHKKQLETQLWNIANTLRGKMNADEFRDYILGFIFYKYLSERMHLYANRLLQQDGITYEKIDENSTEGQEILAAVKEESIEYLGYFLKPSELFHAIASRGNGNGKNAFILDDLDLTSTKLGRMKSTKNELIYDKQKQREEIITILDGETQLRRKKGTHREIHRSEPAPYPGRRRHP